MSTAKHLANETGRLPGVLLLTALAACGGGKQEAKAPELSVQVQPLGVTGGNTPLPVTPCAKDVNAASTEECVPQQRPSVWNGTYAQLLAADAFAQCTMLQRVGGFAPSSQLSRPFYDRLLELMGEASCSLTVGTMPNDLSPDEVVAWHWLNDRQNPACNAHATTGEKHALEVDLSGAQVGTASPYRIPDNLVPGDISVFIAREYAQLEVAWAFRNLCVAQKLAEHLDSAQVAFASSGELLQLHTFMRERSLAAVHQYAALSDAFAQTESYNPANLGTLTFLPQFQAWRASALAQAPGTPAYEGFRRFGEDFALAISMLVDSTKSTSELVLRQRGAQDGFGGYLDGPADPVQPNARVTRLRGPRVDLVDLAYGATSDQLDPAAEIQSTTTMYPLSGNIVGRVSFNRMSGDAAVRAAVTDMSAPEIGVLVALLRGADGFVLRATSDRFDTQAIALEWLRSAEAYARSKEPECLGLTPPLPPQCGYRRTTRAS